MILHDCLCHYVLFIPVSWMNNQVVSKTICRVARIYYASELVQEYMNAIVYISSNSKQQKLNNNDS